MIFRLERLKLSISKHIKTFITFISENIFDLRRESESAKSWVATRRGSMLGITIIIILTIIVIIMLTIVIILTIVIMLTTIIIMLTITIIIMLMLMMLILTMPMTKTCLPCKRPGWPGDRGQELVGICRWNSEDCVGADEGMMVILLTKILHLATKSTQRCSTWSRKCQYLIIADGKPLVAEGPPPRPRSLHCNDFPWGEKTIFRRLLHLPVGKICWVVLVFLPLLSQTRRSLWAGIGHHRLEIGHNLIGRQFFFNYIISLPPHGDDDVDDPGKPAVGSQGSGALWESWLA